MTLNFAPTYLYIKQHSITGKLYFGKTTKVDPVKYKGSGIHWSRHINAHGKDHIDTLWYCLFTEQEELSKFALNCSVQWDIIKSDDWLNFIFENGLDGCPKGVIHPMQTPEANSKRSIALKGKKRGPQSAEHKANNAKARIGKKLGPQSIEHKIKRLAAITGKKHTPERIINNAKARIGKKLPSQTPESNAKRSAAMSGRNQSIEHKANIAKSRIGKKLGPQSPEHIEKRLASRLNKQLLLLKE